MARVEIVNLLSFSDKAALVKVWSVCIQAGETLEFLSVEDE